MVLFDVVTGVFNVVSKGRGVIIFQKGLEMFGRGVLASFFQCKNQASCWDCHNFYIGKTKQRLHDP